jgi:hypothetical protein
MVKTNNGTIIKSMSDKKYLTIEKIKSLQNSIGFLDNYKLPINEEHFIYDEKEGGNFVNGKQSQMLNKLSDINSEREELIKWLMEQ